MVDVNKASQSIISFFKEKGRAPGYQEIMNITGLKSKNSVFKLLKNLVEENILNKDKQGRITLSKSFAKSANQISLLGLVEAGFPTPAEESNLDRITLDEWLIDDRSATFMLKVKGDSMKDAGILQGDYVITERGNSAKEGEIVIAEVDGAWTMKYLRRDRQGYYLEAANRAYKPIRPHEDLSISAVVRAVIRKY
jgi:repressor LexA